ncbi:MAG TPA: hypothetical protein ENL37_07290, partial [Desulfobacteraceae bacterium]|nr:hypothetical protein [Desulfobacteraceae bacterium]
IIAPCNDFKDSDNWRLYFDMGRESLGLKVPKLDRTDYVYAAIPTSPDGVPLLEYVSFPGGHYHHQVNDEGYLFNIGTIERASAIGDKQWDMELFFPAKLMRGFKAEVNRPFIFGSMWGDTDKINRELETIWPPQTKVDYYYFSRFANYSDMVLRGKDGAFGYRVTKSKVNKDESWTLKVYGIGADKAKQPQTFELMIEAKGATEAMARTWTVPVEFGKETTWYDIELGTAGLEGGIYQLSLKLHRDGTVVSTLDSPVEIRSYSHDEWTKNIEAGLVELKQSSEILGKKISALESKGYETAYLVSAKEVIDLFLAYLWNPQGDVKKKKYVSVSRQMKELKQIATQALAEADKPEKYAAKWRTVPQEMFMDSTPTEIREGMFWHHDRPIFMNGWVGSMGFPATMKKLGFNTLQADHNITAYIKSPIDKVIVNQSYIDQWNRGYDNAIKHGLYWSHTQPIFGYIEKFVRDHPKLGRCNGHFIPFCLETEETYQMLDLYYGKFFGELCSNQPNILSFCLMNEQEYSGGCEDFMRMYHQWLKDKYTTVEKLNGLWKTDYKSFDVIPRTNAHKSQGARFDWILFNRKRLTDSSERIFELARKHDPLKRPLHTKPMSHFWKDPTEVYAGVDREALAEMGDFIAYDGGPQPMHSDYIRSFDPDKLVYNSEAGFRFDKPEESYQGVWEEAAHGLAARILWVWSFPWGYWSNEGSSCRNPAGLLSASKAMLDTQRLAPEIHAVSRTPGQIAIMDSLVSRAFAFKENIDTMHDLYDTLHSCQTPVRFITEKQLRNGLYKQYRVIMVPAVRYLEADLIAPLQQFVKEGGKLLLIGDCFKLDQYGREINVPAELQSNTLAISSASWTDKDKRLQYFDKLLTKAGVQRPVRVEDGNGKLVDGIEVLWAVKDERPIVFLASFSENPQPVELTLKWNGQKTGGLDLITNEPVEETFRLKPFGVKLLDLSKK